VKQSNCGASVKSTSKVKKMNTGGFMKIGDGLQKLDVNKQDEGMAKGGLVKAKKKKAKGYSSGGMAEAKRKDKQQEEKDSKGSKKYKRGELVEASKGKLVKKKK